MKEGMAPMRRFCLVAFLFGLACGDSNAPAPPALVVADGDGQFAFVGGALPAPLVARVTSSGGQPTSGATVQWTVTAGVATLGAASSVTDASGFAAMTVTVGDQPGPIAVRAEATGLPPVTFVASACAPPGPFTVPDTLSAALATTDCRAGGYYTDFYTLDLTSGGQQGVTISMTSTALDALIDLYHGDGHLLGFHDDIVRGVDKNSVLEAIVAPGTYILAPRSFDQDTTGAYDVSVVARPQTLANCDMVWVTRGVTVADSVTSADCLDGPYYADLLLIQLEEGSVLTVTQRSTAFDAFLSLLRWDVETDGFFNAAANDDSAQTTNDAHLVYTATHTGPYLLLPSTAPVGATGAYTLTIDVSTVAPAPVRLLPLRLPKAWPLPMRGRRR
jgi:hypothetical protein